MVFKSSHGDLSQKAEMTYSKMRLSCIGERYNKSVTQVILRWLTQRGVMAIPKSARKERVIENFHIFDITLDQQDMDRIAALDTSSSLCFTIKITATTGKCW